MEEGSEPSQGSRFRDIRQKRKLSLKQVSITLGYKSHATVQHWERGLSQPPLDKFRELCHLYKVTPNQLLGYEEVSM